MLPFQPLLLLQRDLPGNGQDIPNLPRIQLLLGQFGKMHCQVGLRPLVLIGHAVDEVEPDLFPRGEIRPRAVDGEVRDVLENVVECPDAGAGEDDDPLVLAEETEKDCQG